MIEQNSNVVTAAFTEEQVERLTGFGVSRLRYWDRTDFFKPSLAYDNRRSPYSRIYTFSDVASLRVLFVLIKQYNVPLQHLRQVSTRLGEMDNSAWARTTLYVFNRKVIFDDPEDGKQREVVSGQYMIGIKLNQVVSDTKRDIQNLSERSSTQVGQVTQTRNIAHNAPVVSGTRVPVSAIQHFSEDGFSVKQILEEYPSLTEADVLAALKHGKAA